MTAVSQQTVSPKTLLRLGRVSNLPTVWTNVLAGTVLAGGAWQSARIALVLVAMSLFYVGGMYLNDYFDRDIDARERPNRPIPAGEISANAVATAGLAMLGAGVLMLATTGSIAAVMGLILAALIVAYNLFHKGVALSPVTMGLCRAFVYYGAAASVLGGVPWPIVLAGLALAGYVAGLTYAARQESLDRVGNLWPLVLLSAPMMLLLWPALEQGAAAIAIYLVLIGCTAYAVYLLARRPMPGAVPKAVGALIAGISLVDATFLASIGATMPAVIAVAGFVATMMLQRHIAGT
jgi:4-hydroxybenzoate polyprenyltransferase